MNKWLLFFCAVFFSNAAFADVRLLIRFDESGHYLHRLFSVAAPQKLGKSLALESTSDSSTISPPSIESTPIARGRSIASASTSPSVGRSFNGIDGFVRLIWEGTQGQALAQTLLPDPRVVHSPNHIHGVQASRTGLSKGAWLATGPSEAVSVTILLPESLPLSLAAETWVLSLDAN